MMDVWGWVIAYVVGFAAVQLLVLRYLHGSDEEAGIFETASARDGLFEQAVPPAVEGGDVDAGGTDAEGRRCRFCGTLNEGTTYTFCRECVKPLHR